MTDSPKPKRTPISKIHGSRILASSYDESIPYDITIENHHIKAITPHDPGATVNEPHSLDARNSVITPSLCHAHIHLDKAFLLSSPNYADLQLETGDFAEAMELGQKAKARFTPSDLLTRGRWLIAESIAAGVTHLRCFAEVDYLVGLKCLDAAIRLKREFEGYCELQICAFAQEGLFSGIHAEENRRLMERALGTRAEVEVLGVTPYAEEDEESARENVEWAFGVTGTERRLHLDFHLDYHLDEDKAPLTGFVMDLVGEWEWIVGLNSNWKTIALGHCTRLTLFSHKEWWQLARRIEWPSPVHFVGLPTSDLFIQGKPGHGEGGGQRPRGTLQIPQMIRKYGLNGAIAVNNVGNAFTPQGSCDPLALASWGVGVYQTTDVETLFECVSMRAKRAIGVKLEWGRTGDVRVGERADLVIFGGGEDEERLSTQRPRLGLMDLVCDPPKKRQVLFWGALIEV